MLMPKRLKHQKRMRGKNRGRATRGNSVRHGDWGLQATERGFMDSRQIEAARRVLTGQMRRQGRVWICVFPDKPVSSKPIETRMGGGKGATDRWVAPIKPGRVLFEISGVESDVAVRALQLAANKLPVASRILSRAEEFVVG